MLSRLRRDSRLLRLVLMLALTFGTGMIDAVGFLALGHVFPGNMTGNVLVLGMGLAGTDDLPRLGPFLALLAFALGALVAGRLLRTPSARWSTSTSVLFGIVAAMLAAVSVLLLVLRQDAGPDILVAVASLLSFAMGVQAATARHLAVKDVPTVVVTMALTGIAADSSLAGGNSPLWIRRVLAVVLLVLGALVGALLLSIHGALAIGAAAVLCLAATVIGHVAAHERYARAAGATPSALAPGTTDAAPPASGAV